MYQAFPLSLISISTSLAFTRGRGAFFISETDGRLCIIHHWLRYLFNFSLFFVFCHRITIIGMHIKNEEMKEITAFFCFEILFALRGGAGRSRIFESLGWGNFCRNTKLEFSVA